MSVRAINRRMLAASLIGLGIATAIAAEPAMTVTVDCSRGETIAKALTLGDERKPLLVLVRGTCNESVSVSRSDVTLRGETGFGGAINGPDPAVDTLTVTANRVAVENISIGGGRNGITGIGAAALNVRNTTVQSTGRNGITYASGSSGTVDGCTVQSNARDGVVVEAASATIINSSISQNSRNGVLAVNSGAVRIGVDNTNTAASNTISQNGSSGVTIITGAAAIIAMNQIANNGSFGIGVINANADIWGGNVISGNTGQGIFTRGASVQIGSPPAGFPATVNTITGNGSAASPGGIFAFLGSAMQIRDAVISGNNGFGLALSVRSHGQMSNTTIQNNVVAGFNQGDGIRLIFGSGLFVATPNSTVSGNAGFGLQCTDGESSVINTGLLNMAGNTLGGVSGSCTGF